MISANLSLENHCVVPFIQGSQLLYLTGELSSEVICRTSGRDKRSNKREWIERQISCQVVKRIAFGKIMNNVVLTIF